MSALGGVHHDGVGLDACADERLDLLATQHLLEHRAVGGVQDEPVGRVHLQLQASVATHRVGDVDEERVGHGIAGVTQQGVDDPLGVVSGGAGVPQTERREAVGVDVLRCAFELRKRCDRVAALRRQRVIDLEQQSLVALDDQGPIGH